MAIKLWLEVVRIGATVLEYTPTVQTYATGFFAAYAAPHSIRDTRTTPETMALIRDSNRLLPFSIRVS